MPQALDLATQVPRSPFEALDGFTWLPRMIDKARAHFAGTRGEYSPYPCMGDKTFLGYFHVDPAALGEVIRGGASDAEIATWVKANAARRTGSAEEIAGFARKQAEPPAFPLSLALAWFRRSRKAILEQRFPGTPISRIDTFAKMLALEEGHPVVGL